MYATKVIVICTYMPIIALANTGSDIDACQTVLMGRDGRDGRDGVAGPPGPPGGPPGPPGEPGVPGDPGALGHPGPPGALGGPPGAPGIQGIPGEPGQLGFPGLPGIMGLPGPKGEYGPRGREGLPGLTGAVGIPGKPGENGLFGIPGIPGNTGPKGEQGHKGQTGLTGATGHGVKGEKGDTGYGAKGQKGAKGDLGYTGPLGPKGSRGPPGLVGPIGIEGSRGRTGPPGPRGPPGYCGNPCDILGPKAAQDPEGEPSNSGPSSIAEASGNRGLPGSPGTQGPPGPSGVGASTYTVWGKSTCPNTDGTQLVYTGLVGKSHYNNIGGGIDYQCLSSNPSYLTVKDGIQTARSYMTGVEYEDWDGGALAKSHFYGVPCAVCYTTRSVAIMIPGQYTCPSGWRQEYRGYLTAEHHNHPNPSTHVCAHEDLEPLPGTSHNKGSGIMMHVEANCASHLCPPYQNGKELTCAVCTK